MPSRLFPAPADRSENEHQVKTVSEENRHLLGAATLLAALLCAFFWTGFLLGRRSAEPADTPSSQPVVERLQFQRAGR